MRVSLGFLFLTGCQLVFPFEQQPDAPPPPIDAPCATNTVTAAAEADAVLASLTPNLSQSTNDIANIATDLGSVGIFRFQTEALTDPPVRAILSLPFCTQSNECGTPPCGACLPDAFEASVPFEVYAMTSDWREANLQNRGVSWNCRDDATPCAQWDPPGAIGPDDRSQLPLAVFDRVRGNNSNVVIEDPLALAELTKWVANDRISLQIVPVSGPGQRGMVVPTHESACAVGKVELHVERCVP